MGRTKLQTLFLTTAAALVLAALPALPAHADECSTTALFAGCEINCAAGQEASCESDYSMFNVACTCDGFKGGSMPFINTEHELELQSYISLLQSLGSQEAIATAEAAQGIIDAALGGDMVLFDMYVEQHSQAFSALSEGDRNQVYNFLGTIIDDVVNFLEGLWGWVKARFSDLWHILKGFPKWFLEKLKSGEIWVAPGPDNDGDGRPDSVQWGYRVVG